jgi:hypothetical protein
LRKQKIPVVIGGRFGLNPGFLIGQSDRRFGDHGTLRIPDRSQNFGGLKLRKARRNS